MKKEPIFLVGIGRSGTTLLRLMFHNHPNIAVPYESHFITDYWNSLDTYQNLDDDSNLERLLSDILKEELLVQWDHEFDLLRIKNSIPKDNRTLEVVFDAIFMDYAKGKNKKRWADKSDYLNRMHIMANIFPNAKFIHIIRDGRDVANSVIKLPWGPNDIIAAAEWWNEYIRLGRAVGFALGENRYTEVKYEDLVENSRIELERLCAFIGENYSDDMINYHQTSDQAIPDSRKSQHYNAGEPPKKSRTYAWKREMSKTDVGIFNDYAKDSLRALDYECSPSSVNRNLLKLAKVRIFLGRFMRR